jgi:hypothetical protein
MQTLRQSGSGCGPTLAVAIGLFLLLITCGVSLVPVYLLFSSGDTATFLEDSEALTGLGITAVIICSTILPFGIFGLVLIGFGLRRMLVRVRADPPVVAVSDGNPHVGEAFLLTYQQSFRRATQLNKVRLALIMRESASYRRGTNTHTENYDHVITTYETMPRQMTAGETFVDRREFRIPRDGMHSFDANRNSIEWFVRVTVEMAGWPDSTEQYPLRVGAMLVP